MATLADFNGYDISDDMKQIMARSITELEQENERLADRSSDLTDEIQALKQKAGVLSQERRDLKQKRDANLATISEIYSSLPVVPAP